MKKILSALLISLLVGTQAFAGLPPTTLNGKTTFTFQAPFNQATQVAGVTSRIETGSSNVLSNPAFEASTLSGWTVTTATGAVDTSSAAEGKQSAKITFSASTGDIAQSFTPTVSGMFANVQMEAACKVNTTLSTIQVCALSNGSEVLCYNASASGSWGPQVSVPFIGGSGTTSVGVRVKTSSSTTGSAYVDDCYVGPARFGGSASVSTDWSSATGWAVSPSSGFGTPTNATYLGRRVGDSLEVQATFTTGTAAASTAYISLPTGLTIDTSKMPSSSVGTIVGEYSIVTTGSALSLYYTPTSTAIAEAGILFFDGSTNNQIFLTNQATSGSLTKGNVTSLVGSSVPVTLKFRVPISGWGGVVSSYAAQNTPASWSGSLQVGGTCTNSSATYADFSSCGSLTLTGITSRNISAVANASSLPGLDVNFPRAGLYNVCAVANVYNATANATGGLKLIDGTGTDITKGAQVFLSATRGSVTVCGQYSVSSAATKTIKLYGATNAGTLRIIGDLAGGGAVDWSIVELDAPMAMPFLQGNVSSSSLGSERIERFMTTTTCTTGTCSATTSSPGISVAYGGSTGVYNVSFSPAFSAAPSCSVIAGSANTCAYRSAAPTTSTYQFSTQGCSSTTAANTSFDVICMGPR